MPGQQSIEVIQFGPNPLAGLPEHPNEVSLTLEDAMEMVKAMYGSDVHVEVVPDESDPQRGKILLSLSVVLPHYLKRRSQLIVPMENDEQHYTSAVYLNRTSSTPV